MNIMSQCRLSGIRFLLISFAMATALSWTTGVRAEEPAGFALMVSGELSAVATNGDVRPLRRKSAFFSGETLKTGDDSKAQVRFRDGSLISMRANTQIRIDEFRFEAPDKGEDKNLFTLINGGFRTITGKIGKKKPENYQLRTSVASIGVRGTTYEAVLTNQLNVAVWYGTILVENDGGSLTLGEQGAYNFAVVGSSDVPPQGLLKPPAVFTLDEAATSSGTKEGSQQQEGGEGASGEQGGTATSETEGGVLLGDTESSQQGSEEISLELPGLTEDGYAQPQTFIQEPEAASTTAIPLDRVAIALQSGAGFKGLLAGGRSSDPGTSGPTIYDNGLNPSQSGFSTNDPINILHQDAAPLRAGSFTTFDLGSGYLVNWGIWDASSSASAFMQTDPLNSTVGNAITSPVYWASLFTSPLTALGGSRGYVKYQNVLGFSGSGSGGDVTSLYADIGVDFNLGQVSGELHIHTPSEFWDVYLSGLLALPIADFGAATAVSGTVNGSGAVTGELYSVFTGANGQAFFSGFDLEDSLNTATHVEGVFLADEIPIGDLRLTAAELASLDRVGMFTLDQPVAGSVLGIGRAGDGAAGNQIMTDIGVSPGSPTFATSSFLTVWRQGSASLLNAVYTDPLYPVSWGVWNAAAATPAAQQPSFYDPNYSVDVVSPVYWLTAVQTPSTTLAGLAGRGRYHALSGLYQGTSSLNSLNVDLLLDFDTAVFSGTAWAKTGVNNDNWQLSYSGSLQGPSLNVTTLTGSYTPGSGGTSQGLSGNLALLLTGSSGDAIAGTMDLEWTSDPTMDLQANFLMERDLRLSLAEGAGMNKVGLFSYGGAGSLNTYVGSAGSDSNNDPIFGVNNYLPGTEEFKVSTFTDVLRKDTATTIPGGSDATYAASWGAWNGTTNGFIDQTDPRDPAVKSTVNSTLYWMTLAPADVSAKTGIVTISSATLAQVMGSGSGGTVSSISYSASVDFDTGTVPYGTMNVVAGLDSWDATFSGKLVGPTLDVTTSSVTVSQGSVPITGTGVIKGVLTGANADAVGGSFDFDAPVGYVEGVYLVK